jgi:hypothetical protein
MESIKNLFQRKSVLVVTALVVGLAIGVLYAWQISPVKWVDGVPAQLREDLRVDFLRMIIDSYAVNEDADLALERYDTLGEGKSDILTVVGEEPRTVRPRAIQRFKEMVGQTSSEGPPSEDDNGDSVQTTSTLSKYLLPTCGITLLLGVLLGGVLVLRRRAEGRPVAAPEEGEYDPADYFASSDSIPSAEPIATFRTTYSLGDDQYDDSFSIESGTGDFLGECGVGVGDVIGVGEPKKVSAFEVWLFDKNDIQTVTKVFLSRYSFNDEATRSRLSAKGDPIEAESNSGVSLETASLRVEARIVEMSYGEGALPAESFFDRLTVELTAWPSEASI